MTEAGRYRNGCFGVRNGKSRRSSICSGDRIKALGITRRSLTAVMRKLPIIFNATFRTAADAGLEVAWWNAIALEVRPNLNHQQL